MKFSPSCIEGVDAAAITAVCRSEKVSARAVALRESLGGRKILLGVDRLDYIKGMPHKLLALETFLAKHPEWYVNYFANFKI